MRRRMESMRTVLGRHAVRLDAMSPLAVLSRGYAIATTEAGRAVRSVNEVAPGDRVSVRVHQGAFVASVLEIVTDPNGQVSPDERGLSRDEGTDG